MAATVTWVEFNGSKSTFSQGSALATNINFGNADSSNLNTAIYPVAAGSNSFEKYIKVQFSGTFTKIENLKLWKSAGDLKTGESIYFSGGYPKSGRVPAVTAIPARTGLGTFNTVPTMPAAQPSANNVVCPFLTSQHLPFSGRYSSPGLAPGAAPYWSGARSGMMVFQMQTASTIAAGNVNTKTISLTYDRT
jgi:hypothetical protein